VFISVIETPLKIDIQLKSRATNFGREKLLATRL